MSRKSNRNSFGNTRRNSVDTEYNISTPNVASPVRQRRSTFLSSPSPSPVFARKTVLSGINKKLDRITRSKIHSSVDSESPVLGKRNHLISNNQVAVEGDNQKVFTDDSSKEVLKPQPLRERKNIVNVEKGKRNVSKKSSLVPDSMSKENIQPVRKSGRTIKPPTRFANMKTTQARETKEVTSKNDHKNTLDKTGTKENKKEKLDKLKRSNALTETESSTVNKELFYRSDTGGGCSSTAPEKESTTRSRKVRPLSSDNRVQHVTENKQSEPQTSQSTGLTVPSEQSFQSQSSENSAALTPRLSKRETLRQMILNGTLTTQGNSKVCAEQNTGEKQENVPVTVSQKKSKLTVQPLNDKITRASRQRGCKANPDPKAVATVKTSKKSAVSKKENIVPKDSLESVTQLQSKSLNKSGTSKKSLVVSVAKDASGTSTASSVSEPLGHRLQQQNEVLSNSDVIKKKPPVWVGERGAPAVGKRRSIRRKSNIFDFSASPVKEGKKVKKQRKPRVRTKVPKPKCKLKSVLVTAPEWENPLGCGSGGESVRNGSESVRNVGAVDRIFDDEFYEQMNAVASEDYHSDNDACEVDEGNVFEMFEGETASSFIPSQGMNVVSVPMVSVSEHPTPAFRKQLDKHLGSSTPRVETVVPEQPVAVNDDIAKCFGFEEDGEETDDASLNLSPVSRHSGQRSQLMSTFNSDMMNSTNHSTSQPYYINHSNNHPHSINQSNNQPYRFSWGIMRPGNYSHASSHSSSMVVHGRSKDKSVSILSSISSVISHQNVTSLHSSKNTEASRIVKTQGSRSKPVAQRRSSREKPQSRKVVLNDKLNASVLFDEEVEGEVQNTEAIIVDGVASSADIRSYLSANPTSQASPEKSFIEGSRKSYDRQALLEAKRKFEKEYGGAATTEAETEEDIPEQKQPPKRKKTMRKKVGKKQKVASNDETTDGSQPSSDSAPRKQRTKKPKPAQKKEMGKHEKSVQDWASSLNSHFSEIEDSELVVL